jgi:hypothetical protein
MQTGDNQNTCTLLLSHFVICMQCNTVRENEGQRKKSNKYDERCRC